MLHSIKRFQISDHNFICALDCVILFVQITFIVHKLNIASITANTNLQRSLANFLYGQFSSNQYYITYSLKFLPISEIVATCL